MGLRFHTGFEDGTVPADFVEYGTTAPVAQTNTTAQAHSGARSLLIDMNNNDSWGLRDSALATAIYTRATAATTMLMGIAFRLDAVSDWGDFVPAAIWSNGTGNPVLAGVCIHADGSADVRLYSATSPDANALDPTGTVVDSVAAGTFVADTWYYLELEVKFDQTVGTVGVFVDNVSIMSFSGDTWTASSGNPSTGWCTTMYFETISGAVTSGDVWLDDIYWGDGMTRLGPVMNEWLPATSTVENDGLGSDGNSTDNHLLIDETPASTADYVDLTSGQRDRYGFADRTHTGVVHAVQLVAHVGNSGFGPATPNGFILSDASESDGTAFVAAGIRPAVIVGPLVLDPDGSVAWNTGSVNAITAGAEVA